MSLDLAASECHDARRMRTSLSNDLPEDFTVHGSACTSRRRSTIGETVGGGDQKYSRRSCRRSSLSVSETAMCVFIGAVVIQSFREHIPVRQKVLSAVLSGLSLS